MAGQTIAEKVMSRQNLTHEEVSAGDLIAARVDGLMVHSFHWAAIRAGYKRLGFNDGPPKVWDPDRFYLMLEHQQPPRDQETASHNAQTRVEAQRLGLTQFYDSEMGICHQMMADYGLLRPGEFVVGTDSHTLAYGALNCLSSGIATDEAAYVIPFGELYFTVPETIKVTLNGKVRPYPFGKDIMLYLAGQYGNDFAAGKSLEFHGPMAQMYLAGPATVAASAIAGLIVDVFRSYGCHEDVGHLLPLHRRLHVAYVAFDLPYADVADRPGADHLHLGRRALRSRPTDAPDGVLREVLLLTADKRRQRLQFVPCQPGADVVREATDLAVFTVVDDVEAHLTLQPHRVFDGVRQRGKVLLSLLLATL